MKKIIVLVGVIGLFATLNAGMIGKATKKIVKETVKDIIVDKAKEKAISKAVDVGKKKIASNPQLKNKLETSQANIEKKIEEQLKVHKDNLKKSAKANLQQTIEQKLKQQK